MCRKRGGRMDFFKPFETWQVFEFFEKDVAIYMRVFGLSRILCAAYFKRGYSRSFSGIGRGVPSGISRKSLRVDKRCCTKKFRCDNHGLWHNVRGCDFHCRVKKHRLCFGVCKRQLHADICIRIYLLFVCRCVNTDDFSAFEKDVVAYI